MLANQANTGVRTVNFQENTEQGKKIQIFAPANVEAAMNFTPQWPALTLCYTAYGYGFHAETWTAMTDRNDVLFHDIQPCMHAAGYGQQKSARRAL